MPQQANDVTSNDSVRRSDERNPHRRGQWATIGNNHTRRAPLLLFFSFRGVRSDLPTRAR